MDFKKPPEWGKRFCFPENVRVEYNGCSGAVTSEIAIKMAERYENAVIEQIAMEAKLAGASSVTVLNKAAILEALEKQTPQKADGGLCPRCGRLYLLTYCQRRGPDFCDGCGQALDWEE